MSNPMTDEELKALALIIREVRFEIEKEPPQLISEAFYEAVTLVDAYLHRREGAQI